MEAYLNANDLWEAVDNDYVIDPLSENPKLAQIINNEIKHKKLRQNLIYLLLSMLKESMLICTTINAISMENSIKCLSIDSECTHQ